MGLTRGQLLNRVLDQISLGYAHLRRADVALNLTDMAEAISNAKVSQRLAAALIKDLITEDAAKLRPNLDELDLAIHMREA